MTEKRKGVARPARARLHPTVYKSILALTLLMLLAAWGFAGPHGYSGLALAVVTLFAIVATVIPLGLSGLWRREHRREARSGSFHDWLRGDFQTWQERLSAREATINILLVPAAAATGMILLALVAYLDTAGHL
jgi:hypothetical protein